MKHRDWGNAIRRLSVLALFAAACGSVSMGGGISGTSQVFGTITGFGSILVNDIEFDTTVAEIAIDGEPARESDLRLGMVAAVLGVVAADGHTGVAEHVVVEHLMQGPVELVEPATGMLVVVGQAVLTDAKTVFDGVDLETIAPGEALVVGGFFDAERRIRASRVERPTGPPEIAIKGTVFHLDRAAASFALGGLLVRFDDAVVENPPPGGLREGLLVEVDALEPPVDGVVEAAGIDVLESFLIGEAGDELDVEGLVTEIAGASEFVVNAVQRVRTSGDTRFEGGGPGDIVPNARVDVEGVADDEGVLVASEVEIVASPSRALSSARSD